MKKVETFTTEEVEQRIKSLYASLPLLPRLIAEPTIENLQKLNPSLKADALKRMGMKEQTYYIPSHE